jgi:prepilin-type N-terminal cleavage/methylation domain-containing protein
VNNRGFSLIEMAIVLMIVGLLLGGLIPTISGQIEQKNRAETRRLLDEINGALIGYAASQTPVKLPCPASPSIATGSTGAGVADCTLSSGVIPWVTLGTSETDAWERRFTYVVASSVSGSFASSFTLTSTGNLNVLSTSTGSCPTTNCVASNLPAVIISHGVNGAGAYTSQGSLITASSDLDEADNSNSNTTFVTHDQTSTFDDLVVWLSPNTLFNRMVSAGKLP